MKPIVQLIFCLLAFSSFAQVATFNKKRANALSGSEFAKTIADTSLSLSNREKAIYKQIKRGNVPNFIRQFKSIQIRKQIKGTNYTLEMWVSPDYLSIGNDSDYFYIPTTPMLAQKIANLSHTLLPTKFLVDEIYQQASIKLSPQPIPPSIAMTTVPVFIQHNTMVREQLYEKYPANLKGELTAGNKKDIIISNKIYGQSSARVVIYGWHQLNGKAIQPVYNKHINTWADYSHGLRLLSKTALLNGKRVQIPDLLKDSILHVLVSDEGMILNAKYPLK
jgi:hypothetical protein